LLAAVADRVSDGRDPATQRRIGDDSSVPDLGKNVILADDAVAIEDEIPQQIEHLRFNRQDVFSAPQFAPLRIERIPIEEVNQQLISLAWVRPVAAAKSAESQRKIKGSSKTADAPANKVASSSARDYRNHHRGDEHAKDHAFEPIR
jgi:hypothetical protein